MKCIYSSVCDKKREGCELSCYRYIKFNNLIKQLNVSEELINVDINDFVIEKSLPLSLYFKSNPVVAIIFLDDFIVSQILMTKLAMYLINKFLMPKNKIPTILNITFNDVVQSYFNQGDYQVNQLNRCDMIVLQEYHTITSPTGRDIINDLIIYRASRRLFTIIILDNQVDREAFERIKSKLSRLSIDVVSFDNTVINVKGGN